MKSNNLFYFKFYREFIISVMLFKEMFAKKSLKFPNVISLLTAP